MDTSRTDFLPFSYLKNPTDISCGAYTFKERFGLMLDNSSEYEFKRLFIPYKRATLHEPVVVLADEVVAFRKGLNPEDIYALKERGHVTLLEGYLVKAFWELPDAWQTAYEVDIGLLDLRGYRRVKDFYVHPSSQVHPSVEFIGRGVIGPRCKLYPYVVLDGTVFIGEGCTVKPFTYLKDACIGRVCKVAGEVVSTVFEPYSNKQHSGFIGNSFIGSWVNIGAGTEVSNLKNTYGTVKVYSYTTKSTLETGKQFLGTFIGDHAKLGINCTISTGTVIGIFANITAADCPTPKFIPDFYWTGGRRMDLEKALVVARRVMARRNKDLTPDYEELIKRAYSESKDLFPR